VCKSLKQDDDDDDDDNDNDDNNNNNDNDNDDDNNNNNNNNNNNKSKRSAGLEEKWFCVEMTSVYPGPQQMRASQRITNMPLYSNIGMQILTSDCHG
jgi:hypothetical protein